MDRPALSWGNSHLASLRVLVAGVLALYLAVMFYNEYGSARTLLTTDWRLIAELGPSLLAFLAPLLQILAVVLLIIFYLRRNMHILLYVGACFMLAVASLLIIAAFWSWTWQWYYVIVIAALLVNFILFVFIAIITLQEGHWPKAVRPLAIILLISSFAGSFFYLLSLILPLAILVFLFGRNKAKIDEPASTKEEQP
jgi:hypothetical protein